MIALAGPLGTASASPASVRAKRAQVQRLQAQLNAIGRRVEVVAERFNGARWRLQQTNSRITQNRQELHQTQRNLRVARGTLATRLRDLYLQPEPTPVDVLLSSGSITDAAERMDLLNMIANQDVSVVGQITNLKVQIVTTRTALVRDQRQQRVQLAAREREKRTVEAILRGRQRLLSSARLDLRQAIRADELRVQRQAELDRQAAIAASNAAARAAAAATPGTTGPPGGTATTPAAGPPPSGSKNAEAAAIALKYLGVPYVWGGASPAGFDCSGLASYAYAQVGISVPHYTVAEWNAFPKVPFNDLQPGDLVFFYGLDHVGIYIGNGQFVHAPHTGDVVRIANLADRMNGYVGAVRP